MKRLFVLLFFTAFAVMAYSQENMITVAGGYSFASIEDSDVKMTGWRINGLYEFNPMQGKFAHGLSIGYMSLKGSADGAGADTADYKISSLPVFYAPKFLFGNDKIKGFLKGALGMHHSNYEKKGPVLIVDAADWGFYGGIGAGFNYMVSDKVFIDVEYEFAWLSSSYYKDGLINTIMGGVGFKF